jgi:hypothetical protein
MTKGVGRETDRYTYTFRGREGETGRRERERDSNQAEEGTSIRPAKIYLPCSPKAKGLLPLFVMVNTMCYGIHYLHLDNSV